MVDYVECFFRQLYSTNTTLSDLLSQIYLLASDAGLRRSMLVILMLESAPFEPRNSARRGVRNPQLSIREARRDTQLISASK